MDDLLFLPRTAPDYYTLFGELVIEAQKEHNIDFKWSKYYVEEKVDEIYDHLCAAAIGFMTKEDFEKNPILHGTDAKSIMDILNRKRSSLSYCQILSQIIIEAMSELRLTFPEVKNEFYKIHRFVLDEICMKAIPLLRSNGYKYSD